MKNQPGGIVTKEMPIHVSNVAMYNPVTQKADRVGFRTLERRPQGPLLQVQRRSARSMTMARLKEVYKKEVVPALTAAVRLQVGDAGAAHHEDRR